MKKVIAILLLACCLFCAAGCSTKEERAAEKEQLKQDINEMEGQSFISKNGYYLIAGAGALIILGTFAVAYIDSHRKDKQ